jgi:hypothetical protein
LSVDLEKTQAELSDIRGLVEYRDWCANGMPGLITPPQPHCSCGRPVTDNRICVCGHLASDHEDVDGCKHYENGIECSCYSFSSVDETSNRSIKPVTPNWEFKHKPVSDTGSSVMVTGSSVLVTDRQWVQDFAALYHNDPENK